MNVKTDEVLCVGGGLRKPIEIETERRMETDEVCRRVVQ